MILLMLLFFKIPFHNRPAREAEKTKEYAPKFVPRANAYIDPMRRRSLTDSLPLFSQNLMIWDRKIVAPMLVPQNYGRRNYQVSNKIKDNVR